MNEYLETIVSKTQYIVFIKPMFSEANIGFSFGYIQALEENALLNYKSYHYARILCSHKFNKHTIHIWLCP